MLVANLDWQRTGLLFHGTDSHIFASLYTSVHDSAATIAPYTTTTAANYIVFLQTWPHWFYLLTAIKAFQLVSLAVTIQTPTTDVYNQEPLTNQHIGAPLEP